MKLLLVFATLFACIVSNAQFETYTSGKKTGLKYNGQIILKPGKQEIYTPDPEIATVITKSSTLYVNSTGEIVYQFKNKNATGTVFMNGSAIVTTGEGRLANYYGAINSKGEMYFPNQAYNKPYQLGKIIYGEEFSQKVIYHPEKGKIMDVDSARYFHKLIFAHTHEKEVHTGSFRRLFFKHKRWNYSYSTNRKCISIIHPVTGEIFCENINNVCVLDTFLIATDVINNKYLFNQSGSPVFETTYADYVFNEESIFGLGTYQNGKYKLYRHDMQGNFIDSSLFFVGKLGDGRIIYANEEGQFIGDKNGKQLSPIFKGFGPAHNDWRLFYDGFSYGYMHDKTYYVRPWRIAVIVKELTNSAALNWTTYNRFNDAYPIVSAKNIGQSIYGNYVQSDFQYDPETYFSQDIGNLKFIAAGEPFLEGLAIIAVGGLGYEERENDYIKMYTPGHLTYNFIDTNGRRLNQDEYKTIYPWKSNQALVENKSNWMVIGKNGQVINKYKYGRIIALNNGYFITSKYFNSDFGLLDPNYNLILKPTHGNLKFEGNECFEIKEDGSKKLVYTIPEN